MTLTTAFHLSSILLAMTGLCTLVISVELSPLWLIGSLAVMGMSMLRLVKWHSYRASQSIRNMLLGAIVGIVVFDYLWVSDGLIFVIIHFLVLFMCALLLTIRSQRDFYSLYGVSFLHLTAAAALTVSLTYAVGILIYLLVGVWTLMLYHLMQAHTNVQPNPKRQHSGTRSARIPRTHQILNMCSPAVLSWSPMVLPLGRSS